MEPFLNFSAVIIFLGVVQGVFLGLFFLFRSDRFKTSNRYLGLLLLAAAAVMLEMLLGYTGYMTKVIHLVDFSEPVNFVVGPLLFLAVKTRIDPDKQGRRRWLHFLPFAFYTLYQVQFYIQSAEFKHQVWMDAWRPDAASGGARLHPSYNIDPLLLRSHVTELAVAHVTLYLFAALWTIRTAFAQRGERWWSREPEELAWLRTFVLRFLLVVAGLVVVKLTFPHDVGDYIFAMLITLVIYMTTVHVVRRSSFFGEGPALGPRKYEKSALTPELRDTVLERLDNTMATDKPYLEPSLTLRDLAGRVKVSPHHLSQVLNEALGCTFHDYLAQRRIDEAKRLLSDPANDKLRIEDLAERVGYFSKSSFNTTFKRLTGMTPSGFRESLRRE